MHFSPNLYRWWRLPWVWPCCWWRSTTWAYMRPGYPADYISYSTRFCSLPASCRSAGSKCKWNPKRLRRISAKVKRSRWGVLGTVGYWNICDSSSHTPYRRLVYRSDGVLECWVQKLGNVLFIFFHHCFLQVPNKVHFFTTPLLHHSNTPILQYSKVEAFKNFWQSLNYLFIGYNSK